VGRQVLRSSGLLVRLALIKPWWGRVARNSIAQALLRIPPVSDRIAGTISAIGVRYPAPAGADPRVGTRAPEVGLRDGRTLYEALRGGRFALLGDGLSGVDLPPQVEPAEAPGAAGWTLVRPDGYVGWVGAPAEFPAWAGTYFRRRNIPVPTGPASGEGS
jgi:hypothetical protein